MKLPRHLFVPFIMAFGVATVGVTYVPVGSAAAATPYYVAPNGSDSAAGTESAPWATIAHAQSVAHAGDTVYFRGGTYSYTHATRSCSGQTATVDAITLSKSGSSGNPINYFAYPGETPVFNFSRMTDNCRIKGFDVTASWIHLKGLEVTGVRQNNSRNHESWGIWISGSNNTFEEINAHNNMGPGLFIQDGGGNLVLNSDSHDNYDQHSSDGAGENADGFGAHISANHPGNVFRGDRAWWNSDDGFDLINAYSPVTIEDCWAWRNGYLPETTTPSGNGNGFKAGGYGGYYVRNGAKHTVETSVAFLNRAAGFYANHHTVADNFFNDTAYDNQTDFNMLGVNSSGRSIGIGTLRNDIAYRGSLLANMSGTSSVDDSWTIGVSMSDSQFQSVSTSGWDAPRQADGSLPVLPNLHLAATSSLIDRGVDVGLPYNGQAPDLGAFETDGTGGGGTGGGGDGGGGDGTYVQLRNARTGLFIDGMGRTNNGDNVGQSSQSTSTNQQWSIVADGSYVRIQNRATGLFIDGMGRTTNGSVAGQYSSSTSTSQQWSEIADGSNVRFKNRGSGLFLDGLNSTTDGADLGQWSDSSSTNQQWTIVSTG